MNMIIRWVATILGSALIGTSVGIMAGNPVAGIILSMGLFAVVYTNGHD